MRNSNPIFITGIERSGSSNIARIFQLYPQIYIGNTTNMLENVQLKKLIDTYLREQKFDVAGHFPLPCPESIPIPVLWNKYCIEALIRDGWDSKKRILFKSNRTLLLWKIWHFAFPEASWIIVRRRTGDIINSCLKTGYMRAFKDPIIQQKVGVTNESDGWLWWIHEQEKHLEKLMAEVSYMAIWPERIVDGDFSQVYKLLDWLNIKWSNRIVTTLTPLFNITKKE